MGTEALDQVVVDQMRDFMGDSLSYFDAVEALARVADEEAADASLNGNYGPYDGECGLETAKILRRAKAEMERLAERVSRLNSGEVVRLYTTALRRDDLDGAARTDYAGELLGEDGKSFVHAVEVPAALVDAQRAAYGRRAYAQTFTHEEFTVLVDDRKARFAD